LMIRLVDEQEPDPEEERLRAALHERQHEQEQQELRRREYELAEAESAAKLKAEAAEWSQIAKQAQRDLQQARSQHLASEVRFRISHDRGSTAELHSPSVPMQQQCLPARARGGSNRQASVPVARKRPVTPEIAIPDLEPDDFQPLQSMQPALYDSMVLRPGVSMGESGRAKAVPQASSKTQMTRKEYLRLSSNQSEALPSDASSNAGMEAAASLGDTSTDLINDRSLSQFDSGNSDVFGADACLHSSALAPLSYGHGLGMAYARGPRGRQQTMGNREMMQRSLRPAARSSVDGGHVYSSLGASIERSLFSNVAIENAKSMTSGISALSNGDQHVLPQKRRGSKRFNSSGCSIGGGTITANHDLLHTLFQNAAS
jgi:hypothetical protein